MRKPYSLEYRKQKSEKMRGKFNGGGRQIGSKQSAETKLKISIALRGEKAPNWKGGVTPIHQAMRNTSYYRDWRKAVYERDNYTCQSCGDNRGGNLEAHHLELLSENESLAYEVKNGVTLCKSCHRKKHKMRLRANIPL
jgi:5-methylcytosine-specific restriction endonuclease McrA